MIIDFSNYIFQSTKPAVGQVVKPNKDYKTLVMQFLNEIL